MSKVEYQQAEDLRLTFFELAASGILDYKDEDQSLFSILQKLLKSEKDIQAQLKKLGEEKRQSKSGVISNDNDYQKQQQLPSINSERKDGTIKSKNEESSCSVCSKLSTQDSKPKRTFGFFF